MCVFKCISLDKKKNATRLLQIRWRNKIKTKCNYIYLKFLICILNPSNEYRCMQVACLLTIETIKEKEI